MTEFKPAYFRFKGLDLHYVEAGSGPLVIFYHGFPLFWFSFHHQLRALSKHYRVVAIDGLGVNLSSKPTDLNSYRLANLAEQIDALARHLTGSARFSLVGHDWGGALAWAFAQQYPNRLNKVVARNAPPANQLIHLLATDPDQRARSRYMWSMRSGKVHTWMTENGAEKLWQQAYAGFRGLPHYTTEHDAVFQKGLAQPGAIDGGINWYRANIPIADEICDADYWPSKRATTAVPALLIWGERDDTFVASFIETLPDYASNLTVHRLKDVGHSPMLEVPETVNDLLLSFLSS
jgi:epoxide hydrolase 4